MSDVEVRPDAMSVVDAARRDATPPDAASGDTGSTDVSSPDARPDPAIADARPDGARADAARTDVAIPDVVIPDVVIPDAALPDAAAPDAVVLDAARADAIPDAGRSDIAVPDAGRPDRGLPDAVSADLGSPPLPDAEPDAVLDAEPDGAFDAMPDAVSDVAFDAALDAMPDAMSDAMPDADLSGFVTGTAEAMAGVPVTVTASDVSTVAGPDGAFRIGPLPPGDQRVVFSAEGHQSETVTVAVDGPGEFEIVDHVRLYRGVRVAPGDARRFYFRFDDAWLLWEVDDRLVATPTPAPVPRTLVAAQHEVFLGFSPGGEEVLARRRTVPGLAGDIDLLPLSGEAAVPLFVEAQPWVRWVGDRVLAMVHTREALSRLEAVRPGEAPTVLAEGVPWLLVTLLADGAVSWAEGDAGGFAIRMGDAEGLGSESINALEVDATDDFLTTTPGRRGLMWFGTDAAVWRWERDVGASAMAEMVLPSPRPRFVAGGRLLFWRAPDEGRSGQRLFGSLAGEEILLVSEATGTSLQVVGERFYVTRPGIGLYHGRIDDGSGGDVIVGSIGGVSRFGDGVVALADGVAWRHNPEEGASEIGGEGLSSLASAPLGATAWQSEMGTLWWLPGPGVMAEPSPLVEGTARLGRAAGSEAGAIYVLGPAGYFRIDVPPAPGARVDFEVSVDEIYAVDEARLLGLDAVDTLWSIDPRDGRAVAWADRVTLVQRSSRRNYVAYVCDRGIFLVEL